MSKDLLLASLLLAAIKDRSQLLLVTTSKALVPSSVALVTSSFLLLQVKQFPKLLQRRLALILNPFLVPQIDGLR